MCPWDPDGQTDEGMRVTSYGPLWGSKRNG